jgi:hypothetical protein
LANIGQFKFRAQRELAANGIRYPEHSPEVGSSRISPT